MRIEANKPYHLDAGSGTQDARRLSASHQDRFISEIPKDKLASFVFCLGGMNPLCWMGCINNTPPRTRLFSADAKLNANAIVKKKDQLAIKVAIFKDYLARQKVFDIKKVNGFYLIEQALRNPKKFGFRDLAHAKRRLSLSKKVNVTDVRYDMRLKLESGAFRFSIEKTTVRVFVAASEMKYITGTRAGRNTFDSLMYHEVEGHAGDVMKSSQFMFLFKTVLGLMPGKPGDQTKVTNMLYDTYEFSAYMLQLDYLISKLGCLKNPKVIIPDYLKLIEKKLAFHARVVFITIITLGEIAKKHRLIKATLRMYALCRFFEYRVRSVSKETRSRFVKLMAKYNWDILVNHNINICSTKRSSR